MSTGVVRSGYGWLSDTATALTLLIVVFAVALTVQSRKPAMPVYGAAVVWALLGIVVANWPDLKAVAIPALIGAGLLATLTGLLARR